MPTLKKLTLYISCLIILSFCGRSSSQELAGSTMLLTGSWITDCVDLGAGNVNRVFMQIKPNTQVTQAFLEYLGSDCSGPHSMYDAIGNPIVAPSAEFSFSVESVSETPNGFHVIKSVDLDLGNTVYIIVYVAEGKLYQLNGFLDPHPTWTEWLEEPDVSGFAADPENYDSNVVSLLRFRAGGLPPQT